MRYPAAGRVCKAFPQMLPVRTPSRGGPKQLLELLLGNRRSPLQAQLIGTQSLWPEKRTRAASSAVGDRSDDGAIRAVDDDFDVFGFVRPVDCILMYAPGTKRKHD